MLAEFRIATDLKKIIKLLIIATKIRSDLID